MDVEFKTYFVLGVICLLSGGIFGFVLCQKIYVTTTEEQVDYIESLLFSITHPERIGRPYMNKDLKIGQFVENYFMYHQVSRFFLATEIENVCGYKQDGVTLNKTTFDSQLDKFCLEVCSI